MPVIINGREENTMLLERLSSTLNSLEKTIKALNTRNTFLTMVVIVLAGLSLLASGLQLYFIIWLQPKPIGHQSQGIDSQKSAQALIPTPFRTPSSKPKLEAPKDKFACTIIK